MTVLYPWMTIYVISSKNRSYIFHIKEWNFNSSTISDLEFGIRRTEIYPAYYFTQRWVNGLLGNIYYFHQQHRPENIIPSNHYQYLPIIYLELQIKNIFSQDFNNITLTFLLESQNMNLQVVNKTPGDIFIKQSSWI